MSTVPRTVEAIDLSSLPGIDTKRLRLSVDPELGIVVVDTSKAYHTPLPVEDPELLKRGIREFRYVPRRPGDGCELFIAGSRYETKRSGYGSARPTAYNEDPPYVAILELVEGAAKAVYGTWYTSYVVGIPIARLGRPMSVDIVEGAVVVHGSRRTLALLPQGRYVELPPESRALGLFGSSVLIFNQGYLELIDAEKGSRTRVAYVGGVPRLVAVSRRAIAAVVDGSLKIFSGGVWKYLEHHDVRFVDIDAGVLVVGDEEGTYVYRVKGLGIERVFSLNTLAGCRVRNGYIYCLTSTGMLYKLDPRNPVKVAVSLSSAPCTTLLSIEGAGAVRAINTIHNGTIVNVVYKGPSSIAINALKPCGRVSIPLMIAADLKNIYLEVPLEAPPPAIRDVRVLRGVYSLEGRLEGGYKGLVEGIYVVYHPCKDRGRLRIRIEAVDPDSGVLLGVNEADAAAGREEHFAVMLSRAPRSGAAMLRVRLSMDGYEDVVEVVTNLQRVEPLGMDRLVDVRRSGNAIDLKLREVPGDVEVAEVGVVCGGSIHRGVEEVHAECTGSRSAIAYAVYVRRGFKFSEYLRIALARRKVSVALSNRGSDLRVLRSASSISVSLPAACLEYRVSGYPSGDDEISIPLTVVNRCSFPVVLVAEFTREPTLIPPHASLAISVKRRVVELLSDPSLIVAELMPGSHSLRELDLGFRTLAVLGYATFLKLSAYLGEKWGEEYSKGWHD